MPDEHESQDDLDTYLDSADLHELNSLQATLELSAAKKAIEEYKSTVLQLSTKLKLYEYAAEATSLGQEHTSREARYRGRCRELGEKYGVDFEEVIYDDVTGRLTNCSEL